MDRLFFADKVSLNHEIDHNPKPEDAGRIKVCASILMKEEPIKDCETVLAFSLPAKDILDSYTRYRWEQLYCLKDDERLNPNQVGYGIRELNEFVVYVIFSSFKNHPDCAFLFYITFKFNPPSPIEVLVEYQYRAYRRSLEDRSIYRSIFGEYMSFDDSTIDDNTTDDSTIDDIRCRPACKFVVDSLSRKVYKNKTSSSDMCTICFDPFKMGERIVTLPCGHEFDDGCVSSSGLPTIMFVHCAVSSYHVKIDEL